MGADYEKAWGEGAHPYHPRGERSLSCKPCLLSHPIVEAALREARAEAERLSSSSQIADVKARRRAETELTLAHQKIADRDALGKRLAAVVGEPVSDSSKVRCPACRRSWSLRYKETPNHAEDCPVREARALGWLPKEGA